MFRKILILCLSAILISMVMSGCPAIPYAGEDESSVEQTTTTVPTTTPTTTVDKWAISAQLAQLTNEDGTGIISLNMPNDEIVQKLNEYNIPYEQNAYGTIIALDGSIYDTGFFEVMQTKRGLKVGDSRERVIEIYGQPDEKIDSDNCYIYFTGSTGASDLPIVLQVQFKGGTVDIIYIKVREEMLGGLND